MPLHIRVPLRKDENHTPIRLHREIKSMDECYRGVPLDGVGWDEPGCGSDWNAYWACLDAIGN